ncbi:13118_t:CDS:2 [Funneliformis caledonium]|uniref:13118_t:CDS:1 n=2 Tax=Funneliformis TaxID=1117308 RepID=A0A9N9DF81_9GLOM|nr:2778_t:CDS:2 [Funneliformis mosseae]CAG8634118.1 13118_t:CDS:2 [Funneliformis caledonium]
MTHQSSAQRIVYPPNSFYPETLPQPTTSSPSRPPQPQTQSAQVLPGTFPAPARGTYHQQQLPPGQHTRARPDIANGLLKKEMYEYKAPWPVYGLDWSKRPGEKAFRLALGSFIEDSSNKLQIITLSELAYDDPYLRPSNTDFVKIAETDHHYPITKVLWEPFRGGLNTPDLLATAGDHLRLWEITDEIINPSNTIGANNHTGFRQKKLIHKIMLSNTKADFNAPLTSFDWNELDPTLAVTSSIDTTCTVWNVETKQAKTQLIAHDKEVYDVAFATGSTDIFASVGADGSVRMFDLRSLEHSTIIYETPIPNPSQVNMSVSNPTQPSPLLRLCFNKIESQYLATFHMDSADVQILDVRVPGVPVAELRGHSSTVNCVNWAPHHSGHLCSGGDDSQVLVWDINIMSHNGGVNRYNQDPILAYKAANEISQLSWSCKCPEWVAIGFGNTVQALRV